MDEIMKDARFTHILRDPAFKRIPKRERKVKIDKRFQSMFSDKKFKVKFTVDKRGRPVRNSSTENLRRYYALNSSDESDEVSDETIYRFGPTAKNIPETNVDIFRNKNKKKNEDQLEIHRALKQSDEKEVCEINKKGERELNCCKKSKENKKANKNVLQKVSRKDEIDSESDDEEYHKRNSNDELDIEYRTLDEKVRARLQDMSVDYARGESVILSDSSSDEESSGEDYEENVEHGWGELDQDAERTDESSHRLAVCNMDWDRIRASDLMVLFNSFLPKGGVIHSVTVYPSEFGLQRMKEEEEKGPFELRDEGETTVVGSDGEEEEEDGKEKKKKHRDDNEVEEGDQFQREKLRQYQLNRLRYFYAVVVCDSVATADALYKECDGMEYESSASHLDLRFVPEDTVFDQDPRETCTKLPNMTKYEPELFITTALQQSKVRLTWDETDPRRLKFNEKINSGKVDNVDENDLKVYLATSSSEGEASEGEVDEKKESTSKYRALLDSINSEESAKREKNMEMEVTWGIDLKDKVKNRMKDGKEEEMTPFQKFMVKRKEKRKVKREEQLRKKQQQKEDASDGEQEEEKGDSASEDDIPSDIDMNDAYFKEELDKEEFAHTKKTKESKNKKNKKKKKVGEESEDEETKRKKAELELLLMDEDDNKRHFSLKDILLQDLSKTKKKKNKRKGIEESSGKKADDFQINLQDQRFSALFTSHLYNIDPADSHYKKTKGMEALRQVKLQRKTVNEVPSKKPKLEITERNKKSASELSVLVKNVKKKAQTLKRS